MIKLKKIGLVIVASIFIFATFAVGGCSNSEFNVQIHTVQTFRAIHFENPRIATIREISELTAWNKESLQYRNDEWQRFFSRNLQGYRSRFFRNRQLVLIEFWSGYLDYNIESIKHCNGLLTIKLIEEEICPTLDIVTPLINRLLILEMTRDIINPEIEFILLRNF